MKSSQIKITDAALKRIIESYAREAGVRGLEKLLGRIIRKATVKLLSKKSKQIRIGIKELESYLGLPLFRKEKPMTGVGVVTGLAWTAMGGATLSVEATSVPTKSRSFKLTGKLGQVMQESAEIAYTYINANLEKLGAKPDFFDKILVHLHVPEGATPKDGPSAGITMATALLSLARNKKIRRPLAMTGELTLTGKVLPVGGIREKIVAARRASLPELIMPEANRRDFEELPDYLREGLQIHYVKRYPEVAEIVFN